MKVGTDGTLLGAWAKAPSGACSILDIGTGTGLIALMMAQRYPQASIDGVDIDHSAVIQANDNVKASPFSDRISIYEADISHFSENNTRYDAIVCNPPFFTDDLVCPDNQRAKARHTVTLGYHDLINSAKRLLSDNGLFSVIIPTRNRSLLESEAMMEGLNISRICNIKTHPLKEPKRCLIEFTKIIGVERIDSCEIIGSLYGIRSEWYQKLTQDFYIK